MRYPGGKGGCFRRLINLIPPHEVYIETHLGGGAVLRAKRPASRSIGIDLDPKVIRRWQSTPLTGLELRHCDAYTFLESYPFEGGEFVYLDPPYLRETRRRWRVYECDYTEVEHAQLLALLKRLPCPVMLSGYASAMYEQMLSDWTRVDFTAASHRGGHIESVWLNYKPPVIPHDLSYLGDDFRQREQIKRRHARLVQRIGALALEEQVLLLESLQRGVAMALGKSDHKPTSELHQ